MRKTKLIRILHFFLMILFTVFYFIGCPSPKPIKTIPTPGPSPEPPETFTITIGSIDISNGKKKIEINDIKKFTQVIKKDSLDILTIQGMTRYPGLKNRIDIFNELTKSTEMISVFGETMTLSGRQSGNCIFSNYPIKSHESITYEKISSTRFEGALHTIIDCGERELVVISTQLPEKMTSRDKAIILSAIGSLQISYDNRPIFICGNLLNIQSSNLLLTYKSVEQENLPIKCWYSNNGTVEIIKSNILQTTLGQMLSIKFKVKNQIYP